MILACDHCKFIFSRVTEPEQCPDCGKFTVRPATEIEQLDYQKILAENENDILA